MRSVAAESSDLRETLVSVFPRVWRYALSLTGSRIDADDLAQSAYLRALENAGKFDSGTHLDRWMFRITHNLWASDRRQQKVRRGNGVFSIDLLEIEDRTQDIEQKSERRDLLQAVLHLPEAQRQAVILVYVEGYSYKEAAMILDVPLGTVMSRLAAARSSLALKLRVVRGVARAQ